MTKTRASGWALPKQSTSFAPDGVWTNIDLDVTPPERRVWTSMSVFGYWLSDIVGTVHHFKGT
jgi:NCS1 family nucleobase:cation symporter-1